MEEKSESEHNSSDTKITNGYDYGIDSHRDHTHDLDISYMDSKDVLESASSLQIVYKLINGYVMGRILGNGTYAEVREMIDHSTLQRRAAKDYNFYIQIE
ncbi:hypothetical protein MXB_3267 [Myxobolus squamalis]|nr:hypothetical protein MXB_3267 [Myxobolus squamalis]